MDIIDVWLPILIILLSALSPLLKTLNNKNKKEHPKEEPETDLFDLEMIEETPVPRGGVHIPVFHSGAKERQYEDRKKTEGEHPVSSAPDKLNEAGLRLGLKNRAELKRAVILSEILTRKYD